MAYEVAVERLKNGVDDLNALRTLELAELEQLRERGDIAGALEDEEGGEQEVRKERTGVSHLVHCWYPKGHNVSD